ncbi:MAG: TolC family protein [Ignavibacteria bacterium]|nr:TolC family protein [Ignavibacteria bacterium]
MKPLFIILVTLLFGNACFAQQAGIVKKYTLEDCLRIGLLKNFDIRQTHASSRAAAAQLTQAFGAYLPSADINGNYSRQLTNLREQFSIVNGVPIVGKPLPNTYGLNGSLNWTLFNGFQREAQYDNAKSTVDAIQQDIAFQRLSVQYNITRQYIEVLRLQQIVRARSENLSLSKVTLTRVQALYDNGRSPITQVLSQETEVANQEVSVLQAENDLENAKVKLLVNMGADPSEMIDVDETSVRSTIATEDVIEFRNAIGPEVKAIQTSIGMRPDIEAARFRTVAAEASITTARAGYLPTVNATSGYTWRNFVIGDFDNQGQWYVGIGFRIPLFDQFQTNMRIENATLTRTQRQIDLERLEQQITQSIRNAYLQLGLAEKGIDITQRALSAATRSFDAMQARFDVGSANLIDVQQVNNQLITARINRVTAVYAYLDARTFVEFTTGNFKER